MSIFINTLKIFLIFIMTKTLILYIMCVYSNLYYLILTYGIRV